VGRVGDVVDGLSVVVLSSSVIDVLVKVSVYGVSVCCLVVWFKGVVYFLDVVAVVLLMCVRCCGIGVFGVVVCVCLCWLCGGVGCMVF